jgi:hypothetical protein
MIYPKGTKFKSPSGVYEIAEVLTEEKLSKFNKLSGTGYRLKGSSVIIPFDEMDLNVGNSVWKIISEFAEGGTMKDKVDKLYELATQKFEGNGYEVTSGSNSKTDYGHSRYFYVNQNNESQENSGLGFQVRVSDHSTGDRRILNGEQFIFDIGDVEVVFNKINYWFHPEEYKNVVAVKNKVVTIEVGEKDLLSSDEIISERVAKSGNRRFQIKRTYKNEGIVPTHIKSGFKLPFKPNNPDIRFAEGGTMKNQLLAPNGKPSNLTPEQWKLVRTPQFKAWFGFWENEPENASKVVDENGEPLVVYHGTNSEFFYFDKNSESNTHGTSQGFQGFFFTKSKGRSGDYALSKEDLKGGNAIVISAFLSLKNPNIKDAKNQSWVNVYPEQIDDSFDNGNDGVITYNILDGATSYSYWNNNPDDNYIVFHPNQIKLADGTNTTFDGSNPDIRFAEGGEVNSNSFMKWFVQWYKPISNKVNIAFSFSNHLQPFKEKSVVILDVFEKIDQSVDAKPYLQEIIAKADEYGVVIYLEPKPRHKVGYYENFGFELTPNKLFMKRKPSNPDIRFAEGGKTKRTMKRIKRGGITYGKSHAEGGIPVKNQSTGDMLEVEGGEGIVNKRSMASKSKVKLNGKDMSICEAVSQLNQMEGGVQFSCEDVNDRQFIKAMAKGGELDRGKRTEQEHIQVLKDLYAKRLTPKEASERIAKDHLKEDSRYYSKLAKMEGKMADGGEIEMGKTYLIGRPEVSRGGRFNRGRAFYKTIKIDENGNKIISSQNFPISGSAKNVNFGENYIKVTQKEFDKMYSKIEGKMADGGKTRKNAKITLAEAVGFDINSIDISKL